MTGSTRLERHRHADRRAGDDADAAATRGGRPAAGRASRSRCRRCRSTCGRPTPTRARRPAVTGFMSTGVKAAAFAAFVRVFLSAFEPLRDDWSRSSVGDRRGDDDRGDRGRRGADERQADAGVLEHRPRRLPAGRASSSANDIGKAPSSSTCCLRGHQPRRLRRDRGPGGRRAPERPASATTRASGTTQPGAGGADDDVPAVARRLPAARRASSRSGTCSLRR